ncbi:MAG: LptF/LptG family permease [Deltaproteobacteria bacterium]|nr:LptF/LptG family permease [Deltaproteobacteria bacterium]
MRLTLYFASIAAAATGLMCAALVVLVVAVTLVESAGDLTTASAGGSAAFWLCVYSAVQYGYQVLPIACFMGTLVAGTVLAHRGELLAAQAAGLSTLKMAISFFWVAVLVSSLGVTCGEQLVPGAIAGVVRVQREDLQRTSALTRFYDRRLTWFRKADLLLFLPAVDPLTAVFSDPVVYRFADGLIVEVLEAKTLQYSERGWWLANATVRRASDATATVVPTVPLDLHVSPADLIDVTGDPRQLQRDAIDALVRRRQKAGFDTTAHRMELYSRVATPLSALWMFLFISPWALHPSRRRSLAVALGSGVVVIAVLLSLTHLFRLLALSHAIPPALGAWGAGAVTLALLPASFALYHRFRVRGAIF